MKTAVIGGGAAGFFLAVNLKEAVPEMAVTIFERRPMCVTFRLSIPVVIG